MKLPASSVTADSYSLPNFIPTSTYSSFHPTDISDKARTSLAITITVDGAGTRTGVNISDDSALRI